MWCQYSSPITLCFQLSSLENSTTVKKFPMLLLLFENSLALLLFCHPGKRLNGVVTTWANGSHACVNMPQDSPITRITLQIFFPSPCHFANFFLFFTNGKGHDENHTNDLINICTVNSKIELWSPKWVCRRIHPFSACFFKGQ